MNRFPMSRALLVSGLLLLATLSVAGCGKQDDAAASAKKPGRPPASVRVAPVIERTLSPRVIAVGTITARRTSTIASGANGIVEHYDLQEGQWVKFGTTLSELRMESSQRQVKEARNMLELRKEEFKELKTYEKEEVLQAQYLKEAAAIAMQTAKKKYDRAQQAFDRGAINKDARDDAEEQMTKTLALFNAAVAHHKRMQEGPRQEKRDQARFRRDAQGEHLQFLQAEHGKRTTKAPFDGYVVKEHTYIGQWLSKGDPVVTLAMLEDVDVIVNVDQMDIRHVRLGTQVGVQVQGIALARLETRSGTREGVLERESSAELVLIDRDGKRIRIPQSEVVAREESPWLGTVVQIGHKSEWKAGSRGFPVKVRIKNRIGKVVVKTTGNPPVVRKQPVLKEGMMASVTFEGAKAPTYLVHKDALIRTTTGTKVNLYRPSAGNQNSGSTIQVGVKTGISDGNYIQITATPTNLGEPTRLAPGMLVVTEGGERLQPVHGNVVVMPPSKK